jgi:Holliday junction resolvase
MRLKCVTVSSSVTPRTDGIEQRSLEYMCMNVKKASATNTYIRLSDIEKILACGRNAFQNRTDSCSNPNESGHEYYSVESRI